MREYASLAKLSPSPPRLDPLYIQGEKYGFYIRDTAVELPPDQNGIRRRWLTDYFNEVSIGEIVDVVSVNGDIGTISQPQGSGGLRYFNRSIPLDPNTAERSDQRIVNLVRSLTGVIGPLSLNYVIDDGDVSGSISQGSITNVDASDIALHAITISKNAVDLISTDQRTGQVGFTRLVLQPGRVDVQVGDEDGNSSSAVFTGSIVQVTNGTSQVTLEPDSISLETDNEDGDGTVAIFNADGISFTGDDFSFNGDAVRTG